MKVISIALLTILLAACADVPVVTKQSRIADAKSQAEQLGHSGPLYDLYVDCLNQHWLTSIKKTGEDTDEVYDAGVMACGYELTALCQYYGNSSCYEDAKMSNRSLYSLMLFDYHMEQSISKTMRSD